MTRKIGDRRHVKLLKRMRELLLEHGPMTARDLSTTIKTTFPNNKRFHLNAQSLSQLMVGRPKRFEKAVEGTTSVPHVWGALPEVVE